MKKIFSALLCLSMVLSLGVTGFASDPHECNDSCTHEEVSSDLDPSIFAEIQAVSAGLNPGESVVLSNGAIFTKALRNPRATCPSCRRSGATNMGILRYCYSRTSGYCNVRNYTMYDCSSCGYVDKLTSTVSKDHKTNTNGCTYGA